ncbi:hypothetical protein NLM24_04205 [Nocardia zapadnayensis]|uniref:hypothetical protein n=1 Tax=Nocardia rhamnosiphila TaxID=426716 RepID=UPI002246EBCE|nr:hypothetical protein [Nocardia zapadnayensis]MCX0269922.1 hypothetical protein [Nocardia zapadnayensis]
MSRPWIVVAAIVAVAGLEVAATLRAREFVLVAAGVPVAIALCCFVWVLLRPEKRKKELADDMENGPAEMLRHWHARAEMLVDRADGSRADWDRHLRPLLAKEFQLSAGVRVSKNRRALESAGIHLFGAELWRWVDPADSALRDQNTPAPGRAVLDEILSRLQRM